MSLLASIIDCNDLSEFCQSVLCLFCEREEQKMMQSQKNHDALDLFLLIFRIIIKTLLQSVLAKTDRLTLEKYVSTYRSL